MTGSFGAAARRLSGAASRRLGWRPDDFWNATPAELNAALAMPAGPVAHGLNRAELNRLMEPDDGRQC